MSMRYFYIVSLTFLLLSSAPVPAIVSAQEGYESDVEFSEVRAVLRKRCMTCHNVDEARGDLDLSSVATIQVGSGSGPVVVPGKPNESLLYTVSAHLEEPLMPPNSPKIPGRELDLIKRWIEGMADQEANSGPAESMPVEAKAIVPEPTDAEGIAPIRPLLRGTSITSLAMHPTEPLFATAGRGQAVLGNFEAGKWVGAINFPFGEVTSLKFSRDGKTLLIAGGVAGLSGTVLGVDVETGARKFQVADEPDTILAMDVSDNGRLLAIGGPKKVVRIYSIDTNQVLHTLRKHTDWVMSLAFSTDGLLLASGDRFGGVFVWNPENGQVFHALQGHQGAVPAIAWDHGSETLLTGCEDRKLRVWNMHHGEMTTAWDAQVGPILCIAHGSNNATLVGGRGNKAVTWLGPEIHKTVVDAEDHVVKVGLSATGHLSLIGDSEGGITIFSVETGAAVHTMRLPVNDGEASQLLARLESMETEFLAKVELNRKESGDSLAMQPEENGAATSIPEAESTAGLQVESAESLLAGIEAMHGTLVAGLEEQQQLLSKLTMLRQKAEETLAQLSAAEQAGRSSLEKQLQVVAESKRQLETLRSSLESQLGSGKLAERLDAETSLIERADSLLDSLNKHPHLRGSDELRLLETLKQSLLDRSDVTRQALEKAQK